MQDQSMMLQVNIQPTQRQFIFKTLNKL